MKHAFIILGLCLVSAPSLAGVTQQEAAALGKTLTPLGGEMAGNADGSIPAWTGGTPKGIGGSSGHVADVFAGEKPLLHITAQNMAQYAAKLSDGQKAMFAKYPDYVMDIYPTHRTASAPDWVYANTLRNATQAHLTPDGYGVTGAFGGLPFPIPKNGAEVMWNHLLAWQGLASTQHFDTWITPGDGGRFLAGDDFLENQQPYYREGATSMDSSGIYEDLIIKTVGPPQHAGEAALFVDPLDQVGLGRQAWAYVTGQRRVRKLPQASYDIPSPFNSGVINYDEVYLFFGPMDRYQWKLVGKKEMYVPYNDNGFYQPKSNADVLGAHFINPQHLRWELHRVWEVDATLAPGKRHVLPHRNFYFDEDTGIALMSDAWDGRGQIKKTSMNLPFVAAELPASTFYSFVVYDLQTGDWLTQVSNEKTLQIKFREPWPSSHFTSEALIMSGVR